MPILSIGFVGSGHQYLEVVFLEVDINTWNRKYNNSDQILIKISFFLRQYPACNGLVEERGLPPSRLMLQQAAAVSTSEPSPGQTEKQFKCDQCEFTSESQRGFKVHMGRRHKDLQLPENLRDGEREQFLAVSPLKEVREELPAATEVSSPTSVSDSVAKCVCCGQRCQSEEALRIHLRDKHGLPKICSDCDTMHFCFVSLANCYKAHMGIESE